MVKNYLNFLGRANIKTCIPLTCSSYRLAAWPHHNFKQVLIYLEIRYRTLLSDHCPLFSNHISFSYSFRFQLHIPYSSISIVMLWWVMLLCGGCFFAARLGLMIYFYNDSECIDRVVEAFNHAKGRTCEVQAFRLCSLLPLSQMKPNHHCFELLHSWPSGMILLPYIPWLFRFRADVKLIRNSPATEPMVPHLSWRRFKRLQ